MIEQKQEQKQRKKSKPLKPSNNQLEKDLQLKQVIGRGTFGTVYFARWLSKQQDVAVKSIAKNPKYKNRQVQILTSLKHPCIIDLLTHYQKYDQVNKKTYSNLVMQYIPNTLHSIIKSLNGKHIKLQFPKVIHWARKLLEGLAYLQQKNVCHRDIKPSNVLIDDKHEKVKICDFGSAKQLKKGQKSITYICSRYYRAPELILGCSQYSNKIDIWAAGCVIVQMMTLFPIFDGSNNVDQIAKIVRVLGPPTKEDLLAMRVENLTEEIQQVVPITINQKIKKGNSNVPQQMIDLIEKLLIYDPNKRLSAKQALNHRIFKQ